MPDVLLMNAEPALLFRYVTEVIERLHTLNPVLVYFYHTDVAQALRAICAVRGSAWEAYQEGWNWQLSVSPFPCLQLRNYP